MAVRISRLMSMGGEQGIGQKKERILTDSDTVEHVYCRLLVAISKAFYHSREGLLHSNIALFDIEALFRAPRSP